MRKRGHARSQFLAAIALATIVTAGGSAAAVPSASQGVQSRKTAAQFSFPKYEGIEGDIPDGLVFGDFRSDKSLLTFKATRGSVGWVYSAGSSVPVVEVVPPAISGQQQFQAKAVFLGWDLEKNGYVRVQGNPGHPETEQMICKVDPTGKINTVSHVSAALVTSESAFPSVRADRTLQTAGLIFGDQRLSIHQTESGSLGKVSWAFVAGASNPEIRVFIVRPNGSGFSPQAELDGYDQQRNAYVRIGDTQPSDYDGSYFRVDASGAPTQIAELPKTLWMPSDPVKSASPAAPATVARLAVTLLPNGKYKVTFVDPTTNETVTEEMEMLTSSRASDSPIDGVYHDEKHMVMIRGGEVVHVSPNRVPMGFGQPQSPGSAP